MVGAGKAHIGMANTFGERKIQEETWDEEAWEKGHFWKGRQIYEKKEEEKKWDQDVQKKGHFWGDRKLQIKNTSREVKEKKLRMTTFWRMDISGQRLEY